MPESLNNKLPIEILTSSNPFKLCQKAEGLLLGANRQEGTLLVNNILLVKFDGILAALALETQLAEQGRIQQGRWYYPSSTETKDEIVDAFKAGLVELTLPGITTWKAQRVVDSCFNNGSLLSPKEVISEAASGADLLRGSQRTGTVEDRRRYLKQTEFLKTF